ncbi:hypothetical protein Emag_005397 [Eimeria magna]
MATQILLVPRKLQQQTPSFQDGIPREVETSQRIYGCRLIQKAGVLLRLEAVTVASAQTILHRFYYRKSLKKFDVRLVVMASLLLACKLEEDPRRVKNLIDVVHLLAKAEDADASINRENLDEFLLDHDTGEFELTRAEIFRCERYILRELGFMVSQTLVHPHSMHTTLCCEVQPAVVAVGSIFLAACDLSIPLAKETGWYELFDVSWEDVVKVCTRILSLYKRPPPKYTKLAEAPPVVLPKPVKKEPLPDKAEGKSEEKSNSTAATNPTTAEAAEDEGRVRVEAEALPEAKEEEQKPLKAAGEAPSGEGEAEPLKRQQLNQAASINHAASSPAADLHPECPRHALLLAAPGSDRQRTRENNKEAGIVRMEAAEMPTPRTLIAAAVGRSLEEIAEVLGVVNQENYLLLIIIRLLAASSGKDIHIGPGTTGLLLGALMSVGALMKLGVTVRLGEKNSKKTAEAECFLRNDRPVVCHPTGFTRNPQAELPGTLDGLCFLPL